MSLEPPLSGEVGDQPMDAGDDREDNVELIDLTENGIEAAPSASLSHDQWQNCSPAESPPPLQPKATKKGEKKNEGRRVRVPYHMLIGLFFINHKAPASIYSIFEFVEAYFPHCLPPGKKDRWKSNIRAEICTNADNFFGKIKIPDGNRVCWFLKPEMRKFFLQKVRRWQDKNFADNGEGMGMRNPEDYDAIMAGTKALPTVDLDHIHRADEKNLAEIDQSTSQVADQQCATLNDRQSASPLAGQGPSGAHQNTQNMPPPGLMRVQAPQQPNQRPFHVREPVPMPSTSGQMMGKMPQVDKSPSQVADQQCATLNNRQSASQVAGQGPSGAHQNTENMPPPSLMRVQVPQQPSQRPFHVRQPVSMPSASWPGMGNVPQAVPNVNQAVRHLKPAPNGRQPVPLPMQGPSGAHPMMGILPQVDPMERPLPPPKSDQPSQMMSGQGFPMPGNSRNIAPPTAQRMGFVPQADPRTSQASHQRMNPMPAVPWQYPVSVNQGQGRPPAVPMNQRQGNMNQYGPAPMRAQRLFPPQQQGQGPGIPVDRPTTNAGGQLRPVQGFVNPRPGNMSQAGPTTTTQLPQQRNAKPSPRGVSRPDPPPHRKILGWPGAAPLRRPPHVNMPQSGPPMANQRPLQRGLDGLQRTQRMPLAARPAAVNPGQPRANGAPANPPRPRNLFDIEAGPAKPRNIHSAVDPQLFERQAQGYLNHDQLRPVKPIPGIVSQFETSTHREALQVALRGSTYRSKPSLVLEAIEIIQRTREENRDFMAEARATLARSQATQKGKTADDQPPNQPLKRKALEPVVEAQPKVTRKERNGQWSVKQAQSSAQGPSYIDPELCGPSESDANMKNVAGMDFDLETATGKPLRLPLKEKATPGQSTATNTEQKEQKVVKHAKTRAAEPLYIDPELYDADRFGGIIEDVAGMDFEFAVHQDGDWFDENMAEDPLNDTDFSLLAFLDSD